MFPLTGGRWTWDALREAAAEGNHPGVDDSVDPEPYRWKALERQAEERTAAARPPRFTAPVAAVFAAVEEDGAKAILGATDEALIPEGGDVLTYGDGGAGKTTLMLDLACHLAAGDDWLGVHVAAPVRVLWVENEGPRPLFRAKLRRKLAGWRGSAIDDRLRVIDMPWADLNFADVDRREALVELICENAIDVVIAGPVTRLGMNEAGTLQEVRDFLQLVAQVRLYTGRPITFVLIHHENKGGKVSGAWEGSGDTLLHVSGQGHGRTRLHVQKARWSTPHHATTTQLAWTDGEGFEVEDKPHLADAQIADNVLKAVGDDPGATWTRIAEATPGVERQRRNLVRDRLLEGGRLVNVVKDDGREVALNHVPERRPSRLFLASDPSVEHLRRDSGAQTRRRLRRTRVRTG